MPVRHQRKAHHIQRGEARLHVVTHRLPRQNGNPHAAADGFANGLVAGNLHADVGLHIVLMEQFLQRHTRAQPLLAHDHGFAA